MYSPWRTSLNFHSYFSYSVALHFIKKFRRNLIYTQKKKTFNNKKQSSWETGKWLQQMFNITIHDRNEHQTHSSILPLSEWLKSETRESNKCWGGCASKATLHTLLVSVQIHVAISYKTKICSSRRPAIFLRDTLEHHDWKIPVALFISATVQTGKAAHQWMNGKRKCGIYGQQNRIQP